MNRLAVELTNGLKSFSKPLMRSSTLTRVLGILVVAIAVGGLIGWLASRGPSPGLDATPERVVQPTLPEPATNVIAVKPAPKVEGTPAPEIVSTNGLDDPSMWEEKLDKILGDADDDTNKKGLQLLEMMPKVGEEAQVEIAGHIVNLLDDEYFSKAAKYLTNAEVPEAVSSVFLNDLYNRENSVKLPLVLAVARNGKHPLHAEARDLLELYIEEDHGDNWNEWESAMKTWLKDHPE